MTPLLFIKFFSASTRRIIYLINILFILLGSQALWAEPSVVSKSTLRTIHQAAPTSAVQSSCSQLSDSSLPSGADSKACNTPLYKVFSSNAKPSFLLGTMHVSDPRITQLPLEIRQVMDVASKLVVETLVDESGKALIMRMMQLDAGDALSNYIAAETIAAIQAHFIKQPLLQNAVMTMKPWAAMMLINLPDSGAASATARGLSMDRVIESEFHSADKTVDYLETVVEQLGAFESLTLNDQITLLEQTVAALPDKQAKLERMFELYLAGDLEGLLKLSHNQSLGPNGGAFKSLMENLLGARNTRMLNRMATHLDRGNVLISVGALHLPGGNGLIALLHGAGYTVQPILLTR